MTDSSASYENIFSEWLAKQVPPAQFSTIQSVFTNINSFCLSRKILKKPLFETDDLVTLSKVRETVESNKIFAFIYRKQKSTMTAAMQHYKARNRRYPQAIRFLIFWWQTISPL